MIKVRLETADGRHVADREILPFKTLPVVLMWGIRTFVLEYEEWTSGNRTPLEKDGLFVYREAFAFVVDASELAKQLALDKYTVAEQAFKAGYEYGCGCKVETDHEADFNPWFLTWSGFGQNGKVTED